MKKTWNVINDALGKQRKNIDIKTIQCDDRILISEKEICDALNEYFITVGCNLSLSFSSCNSNDFKIYIIENDQTAFLNL